VSEKKERKREIETHTDRPAGGRADETVSFVARELLSLGD